MRISGARYPSANCTTACISLRVPYLFLFPNLCVGHAIINYNRSGRCTATGGSCMPFQDFQFETLLPPPGSVRPPSFSISTLVASPPCRPDTGTSAKEPKLSVVNEQGQWRRRNGLRSRLLSQCPLLPPGPPCAVSRRGPPLRFGHTPRRTPLLYISLPSGSAARG